jgi:hypothetical protein
MGFGRRILSILAALAKMWPEWASEGLFRVFWQPWPRYGQNGLQKAYFKHFGSLGPGVARMDPRRPILSILAALAQIWPEWASRNSREPIKLAVTSACKDSSASQSLRLESPKPLFEITVRGHILDPLASSINDERHKGTAGDSPQAFSIRPSPREAVREFTLKGSKAS